MRSVNKLFAQAKKILPSLLQDDALWSTINVDYEPPRVERVWTQIGPMRIMLHRIHPCQEALMHPHPWSSAVAVVSGGYEMGIGYGPSKEGSPVPPLAATIQMVSGSYYEMDHPDGWHYVKPSTISMSLMVTGELYTTEKRYSPGKGRAFKELSYEAKYEILQFFRHTDFMSRPAGK